ncbi:MAG TPA: formate dehydrogenase accessory sulfurtransferase FdhD [Methanothrix sp.]|nr:formate dehydrogenase accessory sulfurtransferase FdhD [Methanothrix sp.]HOK57385.1 formate dehydrogenase accessory sulfurtransferase FdhD [Methanothrix sp.]HOL42760.1 formate dehydrogenase accessory sulfurtransferase FdhD [Methanothrix sp.]HPO87671.1 formate dehydrogenase accessory sulfurtransferase FdhD [Methanothrix sp.]
MIKECTCIRVDGLRHSVVRDAVAEEIQIELCINGDLLRRVSLSPCHIREFIAGHLFSEGYVRVLEEIDAMHIEGRRANVTLRGAGEQNRKEHAEKTEWFSVGRDAIFRAMRMLLDSDAHRITGGFHRAGVFCEDGTAWMAEDIGRHNAMDKVIGHCLLERIELSRVFVLLTSRISSGLALKCSRAGIPILASRGAPTSLAIEMADAAGITLIGFVRGERMNIYTHPERIADLTLTAEYGL